MDTVKYYDAKYYAWQKEISSFGGIANTFKFEDSIKKTDTLVDFGCGGGFLLSFLNAHLKIGIEPNTDAHADITANNVIPFSTTADCIKEYGHNFADVIISNHALEHTTNPLQELMNLHDLLKKGGNINFVVPCDSIRYKYRSNDINQHLFSWSPMNLGNLFTHAGFSVISSKPCYHKWPRQYLTIQKVFGWSIFHFIARFYCHLERSWFQTQIIATKN